MILSITSFDEWIKAIGGIVIVLAIVLWATMKSKK